MRRLALILLLIVTHGLAVWWGMAGDSRAQPSPAAASPVREDGPLDLAKLLEPEPAKPAPPPVVSWKDQMDAALLALPGDADLEALASKPGSKPGSLEATAAFCRWMELDPLAALRFSVSAPEARDGRCSEGIRRYLASHGHEEVNRLVTSVSEATPVVLDIATRAAVEKGQTEVFALASAMSRSGDAFNVLHFGTRSLDGLQEKLPAIRAMLDERGAREYLGSLSRCEGADALLDAAAAAGFSEEAIAHFEKYWAIAEADRAKKREAESLTLADRIRAGQFGNSSRLETGDVSLENGVPEFENWCEDFADQRLDGATIMQSLRTALGNPQDVDAQMRELLFNRLYPMNPDAAIEWIKAEEPDWQAVVQKARPHPSRWNIDLQLMKISPEAVWRATEGMSPEEQEASGMLGNLKESYRIWNQEDPRGCMTAVERLPAGPLKERLKQSLEGGRR
ncbi:hypothetical protein [Luteolibacter sp. Populi]|uniref:hypothetical protein n=1 Tax=Luteolibacter sp. Populi TaxID=3230487 RepID=UPI00346751BE